MSVKRRRSDTVGEKDDGPRAVETGAVVPVVEAPQQTKKRKWRPRHAKQKEAKLKAEKKQTAETIVDGASDWSITGISSGTFLPKGLFSKDEKYLCFQTCR